MSGMAAKIDVLLSTYNGENFLIDQLDSIIHQSEKNWRLLVRDDGSTDRSLDILSEYTHKNNRIKILPDSGEKLGVVESYISLLRASNAPYFTFCDQDDYWLPDKLKLFTHLMESGVSGQPKLIYSDLSIADSGLSVISNSFMNQQRFTHRPASVWKNNLLQNSVVGCASMGNHLLRDLVISRAPTKWSDVVMHDWWTCMIASCFGVVDYLPTPTILYRQHSDNTLGAKNTNVARYLRALTNEQPFDKVKQYLSSVSQQATAFEDAYYDILSCEEKTALSLLKDVGKSKGIARFNKVLRCYKYGIRMKSIERDALVLFASLFV